MATFSISILTEKGAELTATALATSQSIEFTGLKLGDGEAPAEPEKLLELVNEIMPVDISKVYTLATEKGITHLRASFQNKTGSAFYFREVGIYARLAGSGATPILFAYANAGDTADLIDTIEEGSLLQQTLICPIVTGSAEVQYIDNYSALLTRQDLREYLPLAGGTMTGYIILDPDGGKKNSYNIGYDFDKGEGGGVAFRGSKRDGDPGSFVLYSKNGSAATSLTGKPTGELTWDGDEVLFTENGLQVKKTNTTGHMTLHGGTNTEDGSGLFLYGESHSSQGLFLLRASGNGKLVDLQGLPNGRLLWNNNDVLTSAGGDMNGTIVSRAYAHPVLQSKTHDQNGNEIAGSTLYMFPHNDPTYKGGFILRAVNASGRYAELCGKNDGSLTWNGYNIERVQSSGGEASAGAWRQYYDGRLFQWGRHFIATSAGKFTVNLPTPFVHNLYTVIASVHLINDTLAGVSTNSMVEVCTVEKTPTGFSGIIRTNGTPPSNVNIEWYAIGF